MKQFKKRTLALVLASVVTVVGSVASENYKNSLMALNFEAQPNGAVNMILETKVPYSGNIVPTRKDANTYVLMLPEVNSNAPTPDLKNSQSNIESVAIRTMPYSNGSKGYTRITIKTNKQSVNFQASNQVFLPPEKYSIPTKNKELSQSSAKLSTSEKIRQEQLELMEKRKALAAKKLEKQIVSDPQNQENQQKPYKNTNIQQQNTIDKTYNEKQTNKPESLHLFLMSILIIILCAYFYLRARNKMQEIVGNDYYFENQKSNENIGQKITQTVNKLDSTYSNKINNINNKAPKSTKTNKPIETSNIVDLDALFEAQRKKQEQNIIENEEENQALEDFLNGFSFCDEIEEQESLEILQNDDENFLEKLLNNQTISFSKNEMICINKILGNEISDNTLVNIKQFAHSNPISTNASKQKLIEDLMTSYAINQGVIFKQNDVEIFKKLISVELDMDFVSDLRTDRKRTIEMETEILLSSDNLKKSEEIKTLSVKNKLPDLSEEVKKHGNSRIISNYKPDAIYFSQGYDVKTLTVGKEIQDLALDLYKDDLFKHKPSAKYELVDEDFLNTNLLTNKKEVEIPQEKTLNKTIENENRKKQLEKRPINNRRENVTQITNNATTEIKSQNESCYFEGETLTILSSVELSPKIGCHLTKRENGYFVLGYVNEQLIKLKYYETLKSEKIQARKNENLADGTLRFVIRIGLNKFIIDLKDNSIKYVMDLC